MSNWYAPESDDAKAEPEPENPFAAGDTWNKETGKGTDVSDIATGDRIHVDGKFLIVEPGAVLPEICVKTGATRDLKQIPVKLKYSPPWAFAVGGVILAALMSKTCPVTYFVSNEFVARNTKYNLIGFLGLVAGVGVIVFGAIGELMVLIGIGIAAIVASLICFAIGNHSLAIAKHENAQQFWLRGCDASFLYKVAQLRF